VNGITKLTEAGLVADGEVELRISLGAAVVRVVGEVIRVTQELPKSVDDVGEVVVAFDPPEHAGDLIRRFVMQQQVLARRAARGA
jgi:hypothetical protein